MDAAARSDAPAPPAATSATHASSQFAWILVIGGVTAVLAIYGWKLFFFLTDDAFIAFRYVSNSLMGRGLVWNPAPFRPVEGYTSLLWVVILREFWRFTGIEPPDSSNVLSLLCGLATLFVSARMVMRLALPARLEQKRLLLLFLVLLGTVTNRTFLAWLSSGLETALFNLLFTWWLYEALAKAGRDRPAWILRLTLSAVLGALCRPDGLLFVLATALILVIDMPPLTVWNLAAALPLLVTPAHIAWRYATYGDWLPNTYRAKYAGAWPESGLRYLGCFIIEYGVWWWMVLAAAWLVRAGLRPSEPARLRLARALPIVVVVGHLGYYTLIIGGDAFEYRVYSHLVPLLFVSAAFFASRLANSGLGAAALVAGFMLVSWPIPWAYWWPTRGLSGPAEAAVLETPMASRFPAPLRPVVAVWDRWQEWLRLHMVCQRAQGSGIYEQSRVALYPSRDEGLKIPWSDRDVALSGGLGVLGWVLPNVAIIDYHGLNDWVIARQPRFAIANEDRRMAHDKKPPEGYPECFRLNVLFNENGILIRPRGDHPLTDEEIRACESRDWTRPTPGQGVSDK
jgi:arabinofuranosyltransferase